ncbi:protein-L-isoaspartate O-methyltransferase family protein [Lichenifustis flavocetrariae]|uniref:Protein-L-isoaspartate O-methyltransferase n=1 Tax=Lichenifustis flavocetrariae TaxID=2949735 RepID=A0AA41YYH4_9HYPH|nr:protein-L-isoaspartate O-methyltransferase [Lichenifustis flavocetrariae]MCW6507165.1 protein-L-isoaspartate O-methyltransferase [Lichenifustis flavocetrariae]
MDQRIGRDPAATLPARRAMVDNQIRTFDVTDQPLLDRFYTIPREFFLPPELADLAYSDAVLTVGSGTKRAQLAPMVLARMLQGAKLELTDRVLVVGGGTGYAAAIVAGLVANVVALESDAALSEQAAAAFQVLGLVNVTAKTGPLIAGDPAGAPFDLIVVPGAVESHCDTLLAQLAARGRMAAIQKTVFDGVRRSGKAVLFERFGADVSTRSLFDSSAPVLEEFRVAETFAF